MQTSFDHRRDRLDELRRHCAVLDIMLPETPPITACTCYDKTPTAEQMAMVEAEMRKLPKGLLRRLAAEGCKIDVVAGVSANVHPDFRRDRPARGFCWGPTIVVAGGTLGKMDENPTLHELGHAVDFAAGYVSDSEEWQRIFEIHAPESMQPFQPAQSWYERSGPGEFFAGTFSSLFNSDFTRSLLHWRPRGFIERVVSSIA
jgi:hypothetical protein